MYKQRYFGVILAYLISFKKKKHQGASKGKAGENL